MEYKTSFKIPILLRRKGVDECLNGRIQERLSSSLAFRTSGGSESTRNWQELSPRLNMTLNPGYRQETKIVKSEMKNNFKDFFKSGECSPDRSFFKKKDEMVNYTESFFKNKILYSKK